MRLEFLLICSKIHNIIKNDILSAYSNNIIVIDDISYIFLDINLSQLRYYIEQNINKLLLNENNW